MNDKKLFFMAPEGDGAGGAGGADSDAGKGKEAGESISELTSLVKSLSEEIKSLKAKPKPEGDPTIQAIDDNKKKEAQNRVTQEKIAAAAKFNVRFDTFLKEYSGVLPADANEIPKFATPENYPNELDLAAAYKSALMQSFFKEEENLKYLSDSQLAKWKAFQSLGTAGRLEDAPNVYDIVFEPAVNHARSIRQAQIKSREGSTRTTGSTDSEIIFKKVHEKQMRSLMGNYKLNDELHEQAKKLGLVGSQS